MPGPRCFSRWVMAAGVSLLALSLPAQGQYQNAPAASTDEAAAPQEASQESQEKQRTKFQDSRNRNRSSLSVHRKDERFQEKLGEAIEYFQNDQFNEATEALDQFRLKSLNPLERAETYRIYAYINNAQGNTEGARTYLRKAIEEDALPPDQNSEMLYQIAQLYVADQRWADVIATLNEWFAQAPNPNSAAYFLLAIAYFQTENLEAALPHARTAVRIAKEPREPWLRLLLALELTNQNYRASIPLLEQLVKRYPKKIYWVQLSTIHGVLENYEKALVPLQLAYQQDLLDQDSEYRRLAQLLLYLHLPYRAASVMEAGLAKKYIEEDSEAYELLGNSRIEAKEFDDAVEPIERAAELSEDGELYLRLAQVHAQREQWAETAQALEKALEKGELQRGGEAEFLMGIAFYNQNKPHTANRWFNRAKLHEGTRDDARNWLKHIDREIKASG